LKKIKTALVSVFYKDGLIDIMERLQQLGIDVYSTGGTFNFIKENGFDVKSIESLTGYPSILGGRVKTLHPKVFGGILARRENEDDLKQLEEYEIPQFDLVIVDLYPFEETLRSTDDADEIVEKIDIGGIALIRAAAKNYKDVLVVPGSGMYDELITLLDEKEGETYLEDRRYFAAQAFNISSHYDTAIFNWINPGNIRAFKQSILDSTILRYGENPHQEGIFFGKPEEVYEQLHGKAISYNNLLDLDAAINLINDFDETTFAVIKHNNACGLASRETLKQAWTDALAGDPVSAFGGVLAANRTIDRETAEEINKIFFEIIIAACGCFEAGHRKSPEFQFTAWRSRHGLRCFFPFCRFGGNCRQGRYQGGHSAGRIDSRQRFDMLMHGKTHENIKTIRPLRDGVIADFESAEYMIREMIKMIGFKNALFSPALKMVICIPSGITGVEERAVKDSAEQAGAKEIRLIHEPMAAAIGIGIDVLEPTGNMIIDIGGGTSEIAVIALGGIVNNTSIRIAGDDFNADIEEYMRKHHNINIGERTAERIKIEVGAALTELDNPPDEYAVHGRDMLTGIPKEIKVNYKEIAACLDKSISKIEAAVLNALENTPPELSADIFRTGIYLAGGGSMLRGLDKRLHLKTKLPIHVAEDPLRAVARGTGIALKNFDKFTFLIK